jgi:hypothetical protein
MFSLLKHRYSIDVIIMFGKEILMVIFLPIIAVLTCLVVVFLRVMDVAACLLDIVKVKSHISRCEEYGK